MVKLSFGRGLLFGTAVLGVLAGSGASASAEEVLNIYTAREPGLIKPVLDEFTKETGIKVNTIFIANGLEERIRTEGANSPADVIVTVDIGRLAAAKDYGVTQAVKSEALEKVVPAVYRDPEGHWFGIALRGRVVYASKERVKQDKITYEELADPKWKGKVCIRSGQHLYNISLIAAMIAHKGEAKAEEWLKGVKANLAKKPSGGDREQARDILAGVCDIAVGNTYYVSLMLNGTDADQKKWGEAINVILPTFEGGGTHVNVSGLALAKNSPNKANAMKFMEYMVSDESQRIHADANSEYPVEAGIKIHPTIASFGELKADNVQIAEIAKLRKKASELVDKVGFDQ
ncbi:iron ABC transporter substrate-binding protein [Microvirga ossetica]|uniref:Iron ABC transporter substrate-binding protein n=1 Tax=Microvirga ossetica TaxID=1882682 RepID=A0A1B2EL54_9HYPH|nr:Fe(3+) ABC transporter substrate-binding protein [Microvirga ossetica]ANY80723.1 iron ABC transporter substrate-binding protein [Microvirga ossetica]